LTRGALGESHISKLEVLEQWLLFIVFAAGISLEIKGLLVSINIDVIMARITILQRQSPYFSALCELFVDIMKKYDNADF
jgi:hypothetical protein